MPIFEYRCQDCGHQFERLVRRADDAVDCPTCGTARPGQLEVQYSTFAAHATAAAAPAPQAGGCPAGMCRTPGLCGRN
jgi:putative FmdB family regulatory protein